MMCDETKSEDPHEEAMRQALGISLDKAEEILEGPMRKACEELERNFSRVSMSD